LAERTQVICITHLPPVVAYADRHFAITKTSDAKKGSTETVIAQVDGEERLAELCRMLGAGPDDAGARRHVEELLARAREKGRRH
jgi:DNA repair protein RecN (Recombination protein N)